MKSVTINTHKRPGDAPGRHLRPGAARLGRVTVESLWSQFSRVKQTKYKVSASIMSAAVTLVSIATGEG